MKVIDEQTLIERWIDPRPRRRGGADARLKGSGVPVWALIADFASVDGDARRLAEIFDGPVEAVEAALAYYRRHRALIDSRLAANDAHFAV